MLNRPWFIEPIQANAWAQAAGQFLKTGNLPQGDKRPLYTGWMDTGPVYRVNEKGSLTVNGPIQVLRMDAPVAKYDYCGSPGSLSFAQLIQAANADDSITAVILWVDSPGGQVDGTEILANAVKNSSKPIVTYSQGLMCSAAYWIGSSAREVIAEGSNNGWNAGIGSIGTMCKWEDDSKKAEAEGIVRHFVFADASSDKWGDWFKMMKGDYTDLKIELNGLNDTFLSAVKSNRGDKLSLDTENVLTGKVYNAKEALKYGLIDMIGGFDVAVKRAVALSRIEVKSKKSNSNTMNKFQNVLKAANAESFEVVETGFIATEAQLDAVDSQLETLTASNKALTAQVKTLEEGSATSEQNTQLTTDLAAANKTAEEATAKAADLQTKLDAAMAHGKTFDAAAKTFFGSTATDQEDKGGAHEDAGKKGKSSMDLAAEELGM